MFRRNVVALIFNEKKEFLACNRMDRKGWQCVQGGVEEDDMTQSLFISHETGLATAAKESDCDVVDLPLPAAWREIDEEIGLTAAHGIQFAGWLRSPSAEGFRYLFPKFAAKRLREQGYVGQIQTILVFFAPTEAQKDICLLPPQLRAGQTASLMAMGTANAPTQEFRSCSWMDAATFISKCPGVKRHIFEYMLGGPTIQILMDAFLAERQRPVLSDTPTCGGEVDAAPADEVRPDLVQTPVLQQTDSQKS